MASDYENMLAEKKILEKIGLEIQNQIQEMFATMDDLNRFELEICLQMLNWSMWQVFCPLSEKNFLLIHIFSMDF